MDFTDYASRARSPDGRKVAQTCLGLLQDHYPERLGLAFIINPPWWVSLLFTILSPFMDAVTKAKIHFISGDVAKLHSQLQEYVDDEQLERWFARSASARRKSQSYLFRPPLCGEFLQLWGTSRRSELFSGIK
jgi:hypothetical protein